MDFSVEVALDGERLTASELRAVLRAKEGLVLLKGKWVEIDRNRLEEVLEHWQRIGAGGDGVTFLEGMRLLAGLGREGSADALAEAEIRDWSSVVPGDWLRQTLEAMRDPSVIEGFDPERDLRTSLRGYQRAGAHWLWFMVRLGLGACLADDMGLGKTIQTISLLLQLKREASLKTASSLSLLIAPASLLANWKSEIRRFAPSRDILFLHLSETPPETMKAAASNPAAALAGKDLIVTTYGVVTRLPWVRRICMAIGGVPELRGAGNQESGFSPNPCGEGIAVAGSHRPHRYTN